MTKKNKKKNRVTKKKTRDTCSVTQAPPVPTTLTSSTTLGETLTDKLESLFQSINLEVTSGAVQDNLCTKNDDLVFNSPGNSVDKDDYHAWCIDDQGRVCDYTDEEIMMDLELGTCDIVRRPFTAHDIAKWLITCDKTYDDYLQAHCAINGGDVEQAKTILAALIKTPYFPCKNCYIRAKLLHESNPRKYSLVIGSLGFRQADGRIHWEYG